MSPEKAAPPVVTPGIAYHESTVVGLPKSATGPPVLGSVPSATSAYTRPSADSRAPMDALAPTPGSATSVQVRPPLCVEYRCAPDIHPSSLSAKRSSHGSAGESAGSPAPDTQAQEIPASAVVASRKHEEAPQSESPRTHPTLGEMNVTDSGCSAAEFSPTVDGVGDGVALRATVGVAALETAGVLDGVGGAVVG
jgi:hypothetical protein